MIISKNPNFNSSFLTVIKCITLNLILINIFLKESLKIELINEFIKIALGLNTKGKVKQN
ncbi:MAG: hypothetical protein ORN85_07360 [Sediminibacterium sp.]|nr:hypothetical protein [Sediminibacterium sp.]